MPRHNQQTGDKEPRARGLSPDLVPWVLAKGNVGLSPVFQDRTCLTQTTHPGELKGSSSPFQEALLFSPQVCRLERKAK